MNRGLDERLRRLERRRPEFEWAAAKELAKFEAHSLMAELCRSATGEPLSVVEMREIFGAAFLRDPSQRRRAK